MTTPYDPIYRSTLIDEINQLKLKKLALIESGATKREIASIGQRIAAKECALAEVNGRQESRVL